MQLYTFFKIMIMTALLFSGAHAQRVKDTLRYVIDGDTAQFKTMRCRFAYIDTPESGSNKKAKKESMKYGIDIEEIFEAGRYAKRYTKSILKKGKVYDIDIVDTDRYGRKVCLIYLADGNDINQKIVKNGFAVPFWRYIPRSLRRGYNTLVNTALENKKGLWRLSPNLMRRMLHGK